MQDRNTGKDPKIIPLERAKPKRGKGLLIIPVLLMLAFAGVVLIWLLTRRDKTEKTEESTTRPSLEPGFDKGGEIFFVSRSDTSVRKKIDVEIAEDEQARNRGLMFRRSMADSLGMLFIFEDAKPRSFWMENTYIPLDIIFVSEKMEIITIQKNTVPFSEAPVPSNGNARYVIEVNAGFSDNHGLRTGDRIRVERKK